MDVVITYVNGADPEWQKQFETCTKRETAKRFRDWGFLPFQLRCIRRYMPFVDKIFLVVALPSQVPQGLDKDVRVVLHKDIIPEKFLPLFNSASIELFLHNIPDLDERFIFLNDDTIPVMPCEESDFFEGDCICRGFSKHMFAPNMFKKIVHNSDALARKVAGLGRSPIFIRPQHTASPQFKSVDAEVYSKVAKELEASISPTREAHNICNYIFPDYLYHVGRVKLQRLSGRHFSMGAASPEQLAEFLAAPDRKWVCINDVDMPQAKADEFRKVIDKATAQ